MPKKQRSKKPNKKQMSKSVWDRELSALVRRNQEKYYCNKCQKRHDVTDDKWKIDAGHADAARLKKKEN